jgi:hypothetical protein
MTSSKIFHRTLASLAILMASENALVNAQSEAPSSGARAAVAARSEQAPRLDGTLDDPIWQIAPPLDDFRQREPIETAAATEKTEVRILYDAATFTSASTATTPSQPRSWPRSCAVIYPWTSTTTLPS